MICIRFPDVASHGRALGYLAGRFSFKSWASGEMIVPAAALPCLALEGIPFTVDGPATYQQPIPSRFEGLMPLWNDDLPDSKEAAGISITGLRAITTFLSSSQKNTFLKKF